MQASPGRTVAPTVGSFWITTLGCPKNEVDSDKLAGRLQSSGYFAAPDPESADLVVVNTCAFIEAARAESIETVLELAARRRTGARLAVTGCMAERYGDELTAELPEVDVVAGFGMELDGAPVSFRPRREVPAFDLLELPRPSAGAPWAYVKVAEGCDRRCGFCAIPSFRGRQRSRPIDSVLREIEALSVKEVVLVAQDLASYGRDRSTGLRGPGIIELVRSAQARAEWVRLLYLYPSSLTDELIETVISTGVPYFDLSLQHVSAPLLRRMRRVGSTERFVERIERIRTLAPDATLRSSFILGYPGETEADHDELLAFLDGVELDWAGFFTFSREEGTYADVLAKSDGVPTALALERLDECAEAQDAITRRRRQARVGSEFSVLVESPGRGRSTAEAPEIDGAVRLDGAKDDEVGQFVRARCHGSDGIDLLATVTG